MCADSFLSGWVMAGRLGLPRADAIALTYASGMNSGGVGAVVAATRLPGNPAVPPPILAYSLAQKVMPPRSGRWYGKLRSVTKLQRSAQPSQQTRRNHLESGGFSINFP
jgi:predicted Na+-dependent transporter